MKSLVPFAVGCIITALFAFFGGRSYIEGITDNYKDSIANERANNKLRFDSLIFVFDSLEVQANKQDTVLINIYRNEKVIINSVDTLPDSTLVQSIRDYIDY